MTSDSNSHARSPLASLENAFRGVSAVARSGFALILGTLIASGMGMVFWAISARLLSPQQFGIGAALISALTTLSHASQLNLRNLLHRFVPSSGAGANVLIYRSYAVAAVMAAILGTGFALLAPSIAPELAFLGQSPAATVAFAAALVIWTLYALQEAALTALRLASYVPVQSLANAIAKIAILIALALLLANWSAIVLSWVAAALLVGLFTHVTTSSTTLTNRAQSGTVERIGRAEIASFFGWDYLGVLASGISLGAAQLLVVSIAGAADAAPYFVAWSLSYLLYLVARHTGSAMLAELAANKHRRAPLYAEAIVLALVPVTCGAAVVALLAPVILMIFGPHYVETGPDILRVLAVASIPGSLVTAYITICRAEGWGRMVALLQVTTLILVVAVGAPLVTAAGPIGMAWGWLIANTVAAAIALVAGLTRLGRVGALDFAVDLASEARRLARQFARLLPSRPAAVDGRQVIVAGRAWRLNGSTPPALSDATTQRLVGSDDPHELAVLKTAASAAGRLALRREHDTLVQLRDDPVAREILGELVPTPLHYGEHDAVASLLQAQLPGADARSADAATMAPALATVVRAMAKYHRAGSRHGLPTAQWLAEWIDAPLARVIAAVGDSVGARRIGEELRSTWSAGEQHFGAGHGDFTPDNLLLRQNGATGAMEPSGLVDWGGFRTDAPAGLDACTMALATRCYESGRQLGQIVLELLRHPMWTEAELSWLRSAGEQPWLDDPVAVRGMVLLAWLQHVDGNLGKSRRYSGRSYWGFTNIRLVVEAVAGMPR